jgi:hypothetical protein
MDRRIQEEREEKAAAAAAANPAAAAAPAAPAAAPAAASVSVEEPDERALSALMSAASVSRDRAVEAYRANKGDLIASVVWCSGRRHDQRAERKMQAALEERVELQLRIRAHLELAREVDELAMETMPPA